MRNRSTVDRWMARRQGPEERASDALIPAFRARVGRGAALRYGLVGAACILAVTFQSACGGERGITEDDVVQAEHLLGDEVEVVGEWSRFGDLLTAWVIWADTEGSYNAALGNSQSFGCVSVDLSHRIDNAADLDIATGVVSDEHCIGPKPMFSKPALPTGSQADEDEALRILTEGGEKVMRDPPPAYVAGIHPTAHDPDLWFATIATAEGFQPGCLGANLRTGEIDFPTDEDCLRASYR